MTRPRFSSRPAIAPWLETDPHDGWWTRAACTGTNVHFPPGKDTADYGPALAICAT